MLSVKKNKNRGENIMKRRSFLKTVAAAAPVAMVVSPIALSAKENKPKSPNEMDIKTAIKSVTGGKGAKDSDKIKLTVPEIAENGAVVPVKINVDHPMEEGNYVKGIHVFATQNANVRCADVHLTPMNGRGYFATRVKLAKSQDVMALVELSDGTFIKAQKPVKVTIGGCG
jgi:sulfur-oxidizing protein SoxY